MALNTITHKYTHVNIIVIIYTTSLGVYKDVTIKIRVKVILPSYTGYMAL